MSQNRSNNILIPITILIVGFAIAGSIYLNRTTVKQQTITVKDETKSRVNVDAFISVSSSDHILGNPTTADVVIVDYSDLECPYCKELHETFYKIYNEYASSGKVAWVYRHFPLSIHDRSIKEAEATECIEKIGGKDKFWEYLHTIFANTQSNNTLDPKNLSVFAKTVGVDEKDLNDCLASGTYTNDIKEDYENALKMIGAESTPFTVLIVRGQVVPLADKEGIGFGALPYTTMKALIDEFVNGASAQ